MRLDSPLSDTKMKAVSFGVCEHL